MLSFSVEWHSTRCFHQSRFNCYHFAFHRSLHITLACPDNISMFCYQGFRSLFSLKTTLCFDQFLITTSKQPEYVHIIFCFIVSKFINVYSFSSSSKHALRFLGGSYNLLFLLRNEISPFFISHLIIKTCIVY